MVKVHEWDPSKGDARQGDLFIFRCPDELELKRSDEVKPTGADLRLLEGEMTGHHHQIGLKLPQPTMYHDGALAVDTKVETEAMDMLATATAEKYGTARMYKDDSAAQQLVNLGELTRTDLMIGFLEVTNGPVELRHEEHDTIKIPEGLYYVGRQVESAGAEERVVAD